MAPELTGRSIIIENIEEQLEASRPWPARVLPIRSVTVHHTGGSIEQEGIDAPRSTAEFCVRNDDPTREGMQGRGWPSLPYHFFVPYQPEVRDGRFVLYRCVADDRRTYGAGPAWNEEAVNVVFQGTMRSRYCPDGITPSRAQLVAARELYWYLLERYELDAYELWPHAHRGKPSCPGDDLVDGILAMRQRLEQPDIREQLAVALELSEVVDEASDPSGFELRKLVGRFQRTAKVQGYKKKWYPALAVDGICGPATQSMLRRVRKAKGAL